MIEISIEDYLTAPGEQMLVKHEGQLYGIKRRSEIPYGALVALQGGGIKPLERGDWVLGQVVARIRPPR